MKEQLFWLFLLHLKPRSLAADEENVAFRKPVYGTGLWKPCLTDGRLVHSVFSPSPTPHPYFAVDLGAIYNLSSIKLYAQYQSYFGQRGINELFNVYTYGDFVSPCQLQGETWEEVAKNLTFTKRGEEIVLHTEHPVQFIIIARDNPNFPGNYQPLHMAEVMAFGVKLRDSKPKMPADNAEYNNYYSATRRMVIGKQQKLRIEQAYGAWIPNTTFKDVPFGWHHNHVNAMAIERGKGRIVVIRGQQFVPRLLKNLDYQPLREGLARWMGNVSSNFVKVTESFDSGDILIITRDDRFDVDAIYKRLISGENPAVIGYITRNGNDDTTSLIQKLNITYQPHRGYYMPRDIALQPLIESRAFIPLSYVLQMNIDSWKRFRTERFVDNFTPEEWKSEDIQTKLKTIIAKYGRFMNSIAPCDLQPYNMDSETVNAVRNYNALLMYQTGDRITVLPGVGRNPGDVSDTMKATTITVTVKADRAGSFFPTAAYAKPGYGFRWTVLRNTKASMKDQYIRINAQTDYLGNNKEMKRWPVVSLKIPLKKEGNQASPHGGPIFLQLPQGVEITIQFENVYRHAYVDLRSTESIQAFDSELSNYRGVPWFVIAGDAMYTMLLQRSAYGKKVSDLISVADLFDNSIKIMNNYRGTKFETARIEVFAADVQITAGWGHSGYPMMGHLQWSDEFAMWDQMRQGQLRGYLYLLGSNLQCSPATLRNGGPVISNVYQLVCLPHLLGVPTTIPGEGPIFNKGMSNGIIRYWKNSKYEGFDLGYYTYLGHLFGEGLTGNVFISAMRNSVNLKNEETKTQFWLQEVCKETGNNLIPFHKLWNAPISAETQCFCKHFPCFFPNDSLTQQVPETVSAILQEYGKECHRSGQKTVVFSSNIMHGVGVRRPQNIFIT